MIAGRTYLEAGRPAVVLVQWKGSGCPRNVLIRREDGTKVVRPFRGLRRCCQSCHGPAAEGEDYWHADVCQRVNR